MKSKRIGISTLALIFSGCLTSIGGRTDAGANGVSANVIVKTMRVDTSQMTPASVNMWCNNNTPCTDMSACNSYCNSCNVKAGVCE